MATAQINTRRVGLLLALGIVLAPIIFAWVLLRNGYSVQARTIGLAWMTIYILLIATQSPKQLDSVDLRREAFVATIEAPQYDAPDGKTVNTLYRNQRVEIFEVRGEWVRVTPDGFNARWIRQTELSDTPLGDVDAAAGMRNVDPRLKAIPKVGEYGHTTADVKVLREAALQLLDSRECVQIADANKSVTVDGVYYLSCGEPFNRFFRMRGGKIDFCGPSAQDC